MTPIGIRLWTVRMCAVFAVTMLSQPVFANSETVMGGWFGVDYPLCNYALQNGGEVIASGIENGESTTIIYYPKSNDLLRLTTNFSSKNCYKFFPDQ